MAAWSVALVPNLWLQLRAWRRVHARPAGTQHEARTCRTPALHLLCVQRDLASVGGEIDQILAPIITAGYSHRGVLCSEDLTLLQLAFLESRGGQVPPVLAIGKYGAIMRAGMPTCNAQCIACRCVPLFDALLCRILKFEPADFTDMLCFEEIVVPTRYSLHLRDDLEADALRGSMHRLCSIRELLPPQAFGPERKDPMLVVFYERVADRRFLSAPRLCTAIANTPTNNGVSFRARLIIEQHDLCADLHKLVPADIVFTVHGAQTLTLFFLRPGSVVVQIYSSAFYLPLFKPALFQVIMAYIVMAYRYGLYICGLYIYGLHLSTFQTGSLPGAHWYRRDFWFGCAVRALPSRMCTEQCGP